MRTAEVAVRSSIRTCKMTNNDNLYMVIMAIIVALMSIMMITTLASAISLQELGPQCGGNLRPRIAWTPAEVWWAECDVDAGMSLPVAMINILM